MKTYSVDLSKSNFGSIKAYPSRSLALHQGNGTLIFSDEDDLVKSPIPTSVLVSVYNRHNSSNPIKDFRDKTTAAKRIFALAEARAELVEAPRTQPVLEKLEPVAETLKKVKSAKLPREKKVTEMSDESSAKRGRKSSNNGLKLYPKEGLTENPRREGTHGHKSMQIILDNPGISYEEFIAQGGRAQDLRWDMLHGTVTTK